LKEIDANCDWYNNIHFPDMLKTSGFTKVTRYELRLLYARLILHLRIHPDVCVALKPSPSG
jgi:hypothetical protein